jgi:hypothetical protein
MFLEKIDRLSGPLSKLVPLPLFAKLALSISRMVAWSAWSFSRLGEITSAHAET